VNWRLPGVVLILFGAVLNLSAIAANSGVMPAEPAALHRAGIVETKEFENSAPVKHARLQALGDVFAVPSSIPLANVFSVGDVIIDMGAIMLIVMTCLRGAAMDPENPDPVDPENPDPAAPAPPAETAATTDFVLQGATPASLTAAQNPRKA
jgi:hypothetical protein